MTEIEKRKWKKINVKNLKIGKEKKSKNKLNRTREE